MALPPFLKALEKNDPEFAQAIENIVELSIGNGVLDSKTKTLIALALMLLMALTKALPLLLNRHV